MGHPLSFLISRSTTTPSNSVARVREDWRRAREAYKELRLPGIQHANLLLVGTGAVPMLLDMLGLELPTDAVLRWRPSQALELPSYVRPATLVLHDINRMSPNDQQRLLHWLQQGIGRTRTISTASVPLWSLVEAGQFDEALYYRLNMVYVDLTSPQS